MGDTDYWCDVEEFESVVERARLLPPHDWQTEELWKQAVTLYRGDLLMGVDRTWCIPKREALRAAYVEALIGIGRCCEARRAFLEAITWYRRALETDRLREDVHRRIMRCFAEIGRRSKALAQYDLCRDILDRELGVDPAPETVVLYEEIAAKQPA
jgi:two-component SAPR family response regulator